MLTRDHISAAERIAYPSTSKRSQLFCHTVWIAAFLLLTYVCIYEVLYV